MERQNCHTCRNYGEGNICAFCREDNLFELPKEIISEKIKSLEEENKKLRQLVIVQAMLGEHDDLIVTGNVVGRQAVSFEKLVEFCNDRLGAFEQRYDAYKAQLEKSKDALRKIHEATPPSSNSEAWIFVDIARRIAEQAFDEARRVLEESEWQNESEANTSF